MKRRIKVGIDGRTLVKRRGIGNVLFHFLTECADQAQYEFIIYTNFSVTTEILPKYKNFTFKRLPFSFYPFWEQIILPIFAIKDGVNILHCPGNSAPLYLPKSIKLILSIMDVMFMFPSADLKKSPSIYQRLGRNYLKFIVPLVARKAEKILTISECSKSDIQKYIGIESRKIEVIYLAPNSVCKKINDEEIKKIFLDKYNLWAPYLLCLGSVDPRKNTIAIIDAFADLKNRHNSDLTLVITGLSNSEISYFSRYCTNLNLNQVTLIGFIEEADLNLLYNFAEAFLYPSLYEGFGLPVLEAMTCGVPVVTSDRGSIPEVAGEAAIMINPLAINQMTDAIEKLINDEQFRQLMIGRGLSRSKLFSWKKMAESICLEYEKAIG